MIIDTHTHFYGPNFAEDLPEAVQRCRDAGILKALIPTVNASSLPFMEEALALAPDFYCPMIGQHPTEMPDDWEADLEVLKKELFDRTEKYVAVGEIGLDYYWDTSHKAEQNEAFRIQLSWSRELGLPVSIHARSATLDAVRAVREVGAGSLTGVFHSFTDGEEELLAVLALPGFAIGVNGVFTFKKSPLPELFKRHLPLDRLVLETDAPYLAPVPHRGKRNEPSFLPRVLTAVAECYGLSEEETAEQILQNTFRIFPKVRL